jgi:hypothetical protein
MSREIRVAPADIIASGTLVAGHGEDVHAASDARIEAAMTGWGSSAWGSSAWDKAVQIVKDGTRQFGATKVAVATNNSGDHDVALSGADGVDFKLSSQRAAAYTSRSDCRIP